LKKYNFEVKVKNLILKYSTHKEVCHVAVKNKCKEIRCIERKSDLIHFKIFVLIRQNEN